MCAVAAGVLIAQRRGMFSPLLALAARFDRRGQLAELRRRARRLDAEIADVHRAGGRFVASCGWFFVVWALGAVEIALMPWLLGVPVGISRPLTIEVLSVGVDALSFFVPAKLGTQEGGKVLVFTTLGLDATLGLSVGVLRRLRELAWALLGFAIVARANLAGQLAGEPAGAPPMRLVAD
jgi:hypothetical protein